jgi:hypothetical protein
METGAIHPRPQKPAGGLLILLSYLVSAVGGLAVLLAIIAIRQEGFRADAEVNALLLFTGIGILLSSLLIWAAGKALELLSRIVKNTNPDPQRIS